MLQICTSVILDIIIETISHLTCADRENPKHKAEILPVYICCTTLQLTMTVFHNKNFNNWDMMFGFI